MNAIMPSRLRQSAAIRNLVAETSLNPSNLVLPLFVKKEGKIEEVFKPGLIRFPMDHLADYVRPLWKSGLKSVILFGITSKKDSLGSDAYAKDGVVQESVKILKKEFPTINIITDVCLCEYTNHGHCGIIDDKRINNSKTVECLAKIAVSHAEAGADIVAPSAMADGQVAAIRAMLDSRGFCDTLIMAYSVKYASSLYSPFREVVGSAPAFGDRSSYQMDIRNKKEALLEASLDVKEGADILMVKPALPYLDVAAQIKQRFHRPLALFQVSGEYVMIKLYCEHTKTEEKKVAMETVLSMKRAGADIIISYFTPQLIEWLKADR